MEKESSFNGDSSTDRDEYRQRVAGTGDGITRALAPWGLAPAFTIPDEAKNRPTPAKGGPMPPRPFIPDSKYGTPTETGIPVKWVEVSGFPRKDTEKILRSFHSVGTILRMRETPEAIRLRYSDRMGLHGAMQLDGKRISGFHLVVKPLLGDPQGSDPIVYPTKPQFPHMHCSWSQRIVEMCDWMEKLQRSFGIVFFSFFAFLMLCLISIATVVKVLKWCYNRFHITSLKAKHIPPEDQGSSAKEPSANTNHPF